MLEAVRNTVRNSGFSYVLVAALIVIFIFFFGVPTDGCSSAGPGSRQTLASVGGTDIKTDDVNIIYNRVYGPQQQGDEEQTRQQRAQAIKAAILIEYLAQKAKETGLRASDEELKEYLQDPTRNFEYRLVYGREGTWDGPLYEAYVQNQLRVSIPTYQEFKRDELLARKYMSMLDMQVGALPQELEALSDIKQTELNLEFVKLDPATLVEHVDVSEEAVEAYLQENPDEVKAYYESNIDQYTQNAEILRRRIYIAKAEGDAEANAAAKERFEAAKTRVMEKGEDFATVAGEISEDFAKKKQGLMDWSTLDNIDQAVAQAIEDAEVGAIEAVETPYAYILVKIEDKKEKKVTPLSEVRTEIARTLLQQQKVDERIAEISGQLKAAAKEAGSLEAALAKLQGPADAEDAAPAEDDAEQAAPAEGVWSSLQAETTGPFTLEGEDLSGMFGGQLPPGLQIGRAPWDRIPKIGESRPLAVDAFKKLEEGEVADQVYTVGDTKFIVRLVERKKPAEQAADKPDEPVSADIKLLTEARNEKLEELVGSWVALFVVPQQEYGPWIEKQYAEAVDQGVIELYAENDPAVTLISPVPSPDEPVAPAEVPAADEAPAEGEAPAETEAG